MFVYIKMKSFCSSVSERKEAIIKWEKNTETHIIDKGLVERIYEGFLKRKQRQIRIL